MDEHRILIYHFSKKKQKWYDATRIIDSLEKDEFAWKVRFKDIEDDAYVSFRAMEVFADPKRVNFATVHYRGSPCYKVKELLRFGEKFYKIFYENGYTRVALAKEIKITKNILLENRLASRTMAYFRRATQESAHEEEQFLLREFDDIDCVDEESVLALYLRGENGTVVPSKNQTMIFPFGMNLSQCRALEMMFGNRISVVEGPPGTGKTQTILSFIANALVRKKTVAVVSNNNAATNNVYEKLEKNGYAFFVASLGNADNVNRFFKENRPPRPSFQKKEANLARLSKLHRLLLMCFNVENKIKVLKETRKKVLLERDYFLTHSGREDLRTIPFPCDGVSSEMVASAIVELNERRRKPFFWKRFILRRKLCLPKDFFRRPRSDIDLQLHALFYALKIREIEKAISSCEKEIQKVPLNKIKSEVAMLSKAHFENELLARFGNPRKEGFSEEDYLSRFEDFVKDFPVVLSSTYSLAKCCQEGFLFDYLIVDESSQVSMSGAVLAMRMAKNMVVVGDTKQLPQVDDASFAQRDKTLLEKFSVPNAYGFFGNNIMSSLIALYGDKLPRTMLLEHYRCNPSIIGFCNERFYDGRLIVYTKAASDVFPMEVVKTVPGNFARKNPDGTGQYNEREMDEIEKLLPKDALDDVGVISPYRAQAERIGERWKGLEASTIHKFQGREKKTIIFTSVANEANAFVGDESLVNVAVSRATERFYLVTSDKIASSNCGVLADLVNYIRYRGGKDAVKEGCVHSIYDLLYGEYQEQLLAFRRRHKSKGFDSENLTKALLQSILSKKEYASFDFRMHVSLNRFIDGAKAGIEGAERRYFDNPHSHVDFLVYNKMGRQPLLAIEVDGVSFHEQNPAQRSRDAMKDSILKKAGIAMLRLKTNQSGEEKRIEAELNRL